MSDHQVSASRVIAADRQALFDLVADPAMHPVIDGSGSVQAVPGRPARLGLRLLGYPARNLAGMRATLERLEQLATTGRVADDG